MDQTGERRAACGLCRCRYVSRMTDTSSTSPRPQAIQTAHCPRCDGDRKSDVHGAFDHNWSQGTDDYEVYGHVEYRILQCRGCETVFFWQKATDSEHTDHDFDPRTNGTVEFYIPTIETFPAPEKRKDRPDWSWELHKHDANLSRIMGEVYSAAEAGLLMLASVGLRAAIDRMAEKVGIDPAIAMEAKIVELVERGRIGDTEADTLRVVANAGNAAAHQGWAPDMPAFEHLRKTVEQFIYRTLFVGEGPLALAANIPGRQKRKQVKAGPVQGQTAAARPLPPPLSKPVG